VEGLRQLGGQHRALATPNFLDKCNLMRQASNCFGKNASTFPIDKETSEEMLQSMYLAFTLPSVTMYSEQFFCSGEDFVPLFQKLFP
jgi:hypothetical protein